MNRDLFPYFIGVCITFLELFAIKAFDSNLLIGLFVAFLFIYIAFFLIMRRTYEKQKRKVGNDLPLDTILWRYNEVTDKPLSNVLAVAKLLLFFVYGGLLLVPIKTLSISEWSILPALLGFVSIYLRTTTSQFVADEYRVATWETGLTTKERLYLYKTLHAFMTMAILPIFPFCFYGHPIVRTIAPFCIWAVLGFVSMIVRSRLKME